MDFSKTRLYQRTRSRYDKLYSEFNQKKKAERRSSGGSVGTAESSGKSSEGLRGSDEIDARPRKVRKGIKGKEQLGKVSKRGKNVSGVNLIDDESEETDEDDLGLNKCSGSGKIEKKSQRGNSLERGKNVSRNSLIDELEDDDDTLSYLGGNIEKKSEKGFVDNPTASNEDCLKGNRGLGENLDINTSVSSHGGFLNETDDDEGVIYLGDNVTCLDEYAPSHSSRVESNEVKSSEEDDDHWQELGSSEEDDNDDDDDSDDYAGDKDFIVISSSSSEEEDENVMMVGNDGDSIVLERENLVTEVVEEITSDEEAENMNEKKKQKENFIEAVVSKKRYFGGNEKEETKKRRTDNTDTFLDCGKLKKKQPIQRIVHEPFWVEDTGEGSVRNFDRIIEEKGTQKAGKSMSRKYDEFGNKVDVIKILMDTIREEGDGDELLRKYVSQPEETPQEEPPVGRVLPYKFRFEDEEDVNLEKSESEIEVDGLFNEMNMCFQLSEIGSSGIHVVGRDGADFLAEDTNQALRCRQGKHLLTINEQFGIICRCCSHVEMEIRDILPPLSKNGRGGHDKYDYDKSDGLKFPNLKWSDSGHECHLDSRKCKFEKGTVWDLVPGVRETMYSHQREGFEFIWTKIAGETYIEKLEKRLPNGGSGCIISHAPGTGKSRLTIVFLQSFLRMYPSSRPLIIAPRSMLLTWEEEFKKWDVDIPFYILNNSEISGQEHTVAATLLKQSGNGKSLRGLRLLKLYSWKKKSSVLGITYRLFESLAGEEGKRKHAVNNPEDEEIKKILLEVPTLVVLDEGHTPRNDQSLMWKALLKVKTKRSIILSGTPFQNNFDELYNTLCLVNPILLYGISDVFTKKRGWKNIAARGQWDSITSSIRKSHHKKLHELKIHELRAMIDPFVHVHKGTILQEKLPGLRDALVVLKPTKMQQKLLGSMIGSKLSLENDHLTSLISVHPSLLPKSFPNQEKFRKVLKLFEKDPRAGVKTHFLLELIKLSDALNEKVLVFSQYIKPLVFILQLLKINYKWIEGRDFLYMDGQQEEKHRQSSINALNDPKSEVKVLLASLRACSEGINLVGASRVVLLDVHWNPSVERQAISRAYRLGQKKLVHVYHLVTGTLEGEKYVRQVEKSHLSELVFSSKNKDNLNPKISSSVSIDKILEEMVQHEKLQDMFEMVIYQPKESDLIHTFG